MVVIDDRLRILRAAARDWATQARPLALDLDRDPDLVFKHLDLPMVTHLSRMMIPPEHNGEPVVVDGHRFFGMQTLERVVAIEELACADAGMMLAAPGPSLSGVMVDQLGDDEQKAFYYGRLMEKPTWTFFALTEPARGSDATAMDTSLTPSGHDGTLLLNGAKRYIGNAVRADIGVVFARTMPGPLGVTAVLVDPAADGFHAQRLETLGLRGACLSAITLESVEIAPERVLGRHLSGLRRGMWSAVQTFNRFRPAVAAIALGIARAAHEYVLANRGDLRTAERAALDRMGRRLTATRHLVLEAAAAVDRDPSDGYLASAAKFRAARLAEEITLAAPGYFSPGARLEHPLLDKLARDARGVEFMEGTRNIQKLNVFHGLIRRKLDHD